MRRKQAAYLGSVSVLFSSSSRCVDDLRGRVNSNRRRLPALGPAHPMTAHGGRRAKVRGWSCSSSPRPRLSRGPGGVDRTERVCNATGRRLLSPHADTPRRTVDARCVRPCSPFTSMLADIARRAAPMWRLRGPGHIPARAGSPFEWHAGRHTRFDGVQAGTRARSARRGDDTRKLTRTRSE